MVMPNQKNYAVAFLDFAKKNPDRVAYATSAGTVSYRSFARLVMAYSLHLHVRGVTPRARVAIFGPASIDSLALALAVNALGAAWSHVLHPIPAGALQPTHSFLLPVNPGDTREGAETIDVSWSRVPRGMRQSAAPELRGFTGPTAPAVIAATSGTTGTPKLVLRSVGQVVELMGRSPVDQFAGVATTFPLTMMFGFRVAVATLLAGRTLVEPAGFQQLQAGGADALFASPVQVDRVLEGAVRPDRRMALLHVGGAVVTREQIAHWQDFFERIEIAYGSREAGDSGHMVIGREPAPETLLYTIHDDVTLEIVDPDGAPVPQGETGEVRVRTPAMATGYYNDAEGSARAFRDGWFYPGDSGRLLPDGRLEITGRDNEVVNIRGVKIALPFIDSLLAKVEGVGGVLSYTLPGQGASSGLGLHVRPRDPDSSDAVLQVLAARVRDTLEARLGAALRPDEIGFVDSLPVNDAGKPVRAREAQVKPLGRGTY